MKDPTTASEWMVVARERGADAEAMLPERATSIGPVYMAGYAIECSIKAYLQKAGIPRPASGRDGHNLRGLWKAAGFRLSDLKDPYGHKSFFVETWTTDLRYQRQCPDSAEDSEALLKAAKELVGWLNAAIKRTRRTR